MNENEKFCIHVETEKIGRARLLRSLIILSPILIALVIISIVAIINHRFSLPIPAWNDEAAYYSLIKTWLATGNPVGFWGFNGGHALVGTGSGWPIAILLPYALFGMMFSWNYSSVFFANILFLCFAHLLLLHITKPKENILIRILILEWTSVLTILYSTTSMSEPLRYSLVIILAALFYKLYFMDTTRIFRYILVPLYIIAISQVYIFLVFCVPIYIFGILQKKSVWKKFLFSFLSMSLVAGGSYYLLHLISSNYNIFKTEKIFYYLKNFDLPGAVFAFLRNVKDGLISFASLFTIYGGYGMFLWFVPLCILFIIIPFILFINKRKKVLKDNEQCIEHRYLGTDGSIYLIMTYSVGLFLFMYLSIYSLERFTFLRGVGIVIIFAMYMATFLKSCKGYLFFAILYGVGIFFLPMNLANFNAERYPDTEIRLAWDALEINLEDALILEDSTNPWDNTVAVYSLEPRVLCAIPAGFGINMMMDSSLFADNAKYILIPIKNPALLRGDWLEANHEIFEGQFKEELILYQIIYEDKGIRIYRKQ